MFVFEMAVDFGKHGRIADGDRQVLLFDWFPVDAAELVNLIYQASDNNFILDQFTMRAADI